MNFISSLVFKFCGNLFRMGYLIEIPEHQEIFGMGSVTIGEGAENIAYDVFLEEFTPTEMGQWMKKCSEYHIILGLRPERGRPINILDWYQKDSYDVYISAIRFHEASDVINFKLKFL